MIVTYDIIVDLSVRR